jgi:methyl-accepting chemotaxis protein
LSGLIGQFQIGRASAGASLRRELQKAAPHVFRQPAKAPAAQAPRAEPRKSASQPVRSAPKAVVNGAPAGGDADSWEEF